MKRICFLIFVLLTLMAVKGLKGQSQYGNFPFQASFLNNRMPSGVIKPDPTKNNAKLTDKGMQLTDSLETQFGAIYLNDHKFKSELGIFIEFEYMAYNGNGGDGLCVFFFDAKEPSPNIGAPGAGLGYAYNRAYYTQYPEGSSIRREGLRGAYLGIGLDSYGNFSGLRWQTNSRVQGLPYSNYSKSGFDIYQKNGNNEVTLRGGRRTTPVTTGGGSIIRGMDVGYVGYPVLVTQRTNERVGFILSDNNQNDPKYIESNQLRARDTFTIRGGKSFERPTDEGYRKAYIEMFPNGSKGDPANEGFYISVMIERNKQEGGKIVMVKDTVIYDYNYRAQTYYYENAWNGSSGDDVRDEFDGFGITRKLLTIALPVELKIGFAAATGTTFGSAQGFTDKHIIKNVGIRLPESAEARDDFLTTHWVGTPSIEFSPLLNDLGYTGQVTRHKKGSPEHLDPGTFKFVDIDGNVPANPYELVVAGEGTWRYTYSGDYTTAKATFYPLPTFKEEARVKYIIKAKNDTPNPHGDDAYYSVPATMGVDLKDNPNPGRNVISNKMVTPALR